MKPKKDKRSGVEILIAEDSATQREQIRGLLEKHGYAVVAAANGKEALEAARRRKPTLIITDIVMPELDGYGLCKAVKSDDKLKDVPVVLLTMLADPLDVVRGLECGADNFIRKPYEGDYLLSRIDYLLMNLDLRKNQKMRMGIEISLGGQRHFITAERQQILDLLVSTYEQAVLVNNELKLREKALAHSNQVLNGLYRIAEGLNRAAGEQEVAELVLERALELPGIQAGWISLREEESGFRLAAARNLPPALASPGALEGSCECRRRLLSGELDSVSNILECERLGKAKGDTRGLRCHASVPLWIGKQMVGVMNLAGPGDGLFNEEELKVLYSVGNQVAVAMERAKLQEHLEKLVEERTAALKAEVEERRRIQEEQARLVAIIEATPDMVATGDQNGHVLYYNRAGLRMLGFEPGLDVSTVRFLETHPEWAAKLVAETGIPHAIEHGTWSGETALLGRDGREIPISQVIIAHKGPDGSVEYLSTIARDITQRKEYEDRLMRLNRIYSVLSGINTTIVRVHDRQELFDEACRIAVDHGKFTFAWVGMLDADMQEVKPVAKAGRDDGYLAQINLTAVEGASGNCELTARALSRAEPVICNDIAADDRMKSWRAEALKRGYRSVVLFPLILEKRAVGVFVLYAPEPDVFDEEEMRLLVEMAGDISFAMDHLKKEERLNYLAYYDELTGLPNRTLFDDRASQLLQAARRSEGATVALVLLDLERFRTINESLGRHTGDAVLRQVAQRLSSGRLGPDHLARIGADTFAALLADVEKEQDIVHFVEKRVIDLLHEPVVVDGHELRLSARAGVALFPADGTDTDTLFRNAEAALKRTKLSGDKYLFYTPELNARVAERLTLENKLRGAVERRELTLHYQPKVDLKTGRISGLEALMRWNDPDAGAVPPAKFIPIMEETGLILEAGRWALDQAFADYQQWLAAGLAVPRIAVNVSAIQLRQKNFVDTVREVIAARTVPGGHEGGGLDLELTESLIMRDIEANIEKLEAVREMGVEVAIDDFGTGYSSLSYIARLPINALKIDRAFIMNLTRNPGDVSIVTTIISLAHSLDLRVVAEGVETEEQAKLLRLLKCDEFQGYLFSPAVPAERIEIFLKENKSLSN
jgi:diguanylate cyclase (GGDEF)-like protein/PAS domain S-box-containing protein